MSQGNHFLFICLGMPSRVRIQPALLLSQKPRGSSQPALDVAACGWPGWLLARRSHCSYRAGCSEGHNGARKSLPGSSENLSCSMWVWTCSMLTSLSPNIHRWPLSEADTVRRPLHGHVRGRRSGTAKCHIPAPVTRARGLISSHIFFVYLVPPPPPLRQCQVLIQS